MAVFKIEIQDHNGNVYYPKTSADIVIYETGTNAGKTLKQIDKQLKIDQEVYKL